MKALIIATIVLAAFLIVVGQFYEWDMWSYIIGMVAAAIFRTANDIAEDVLND